MKTISEWGGGLRCLMSIVIRRVFFTLYAYVCVGERIPITIHEVQNNHSYICVVHLLPHHVNYMLVASLLVGSVFMCKALS